VGDRLGIGEVHPGKMKDFRSQGVEVRKLRCQTRGRPIRPGQEIHVGGASATLVCLQADWLGSF